MPYRDEFPCLLCWCHAELWFLVGICAPEAMTENLTQGFILAETFCAAEFALLVDFCGGWHTPNTIAIPSRWNMAGAQFHRVCLVLSA